MAPSFPLIQTKYNNCLTQWVSLYITMQNHLWPFDLVLNKQNHITKMLVSAHLSCSEAKVLECAKHFASIIAGTAGGRHANSGDLGDALLHDVFFYCP